MTKGIFDEREHALEANYFRQQDAKLIDKLRQNAKLDEIATVLAEKLQVDNPDLLLRARQLGINADTAAALFVAPLVQVAWAEGSVGRQERNAVLRLARGRGVEIGSPAYTQLVEWLKVRPSDSLFETALEVIRSGFAVLPPGEIEERIGRVIDACREVAAASGNTLAQALRLGLGSATSDTETAMLDTIANKLRSHPRPAA
jgi:hypothetical protein